MRHEIAAPVKIQVVLGGREYDMRRPSIGAFADHEDAVAEAQAAGKSTTRLLIKLVASCGLPEAVVSNLDTDQLIPLVEVLKPVKKS